MESRLALDEMTKNLEQFPILKETLGQNWLIKQSKKPIESWSLITEWLSRFYEDDYRNLLLGLERKLSYIEEKANIDIWKKISSKIRHHSDRENTKGTLSEIVICWYLLGCGFKFDMEQILLQHGNSDVDLTVYDPSGCEISIEIHYLRESDRDRRLNQISANYGGMPFNSDEGHESRRILNKIKEKSKKFPNDKITLIGFNISDDPLNKNRLLQFYNWLIVDKVDGFMIFDWDNSLNLKINGFNLNPNSPHLEKINKSNLLGFSNLICCHTYPSLPPAPCDARPHDEMDG